MTRRAFSALRVIRVKGELTSRMVQDFSYFFARKMIIAQNPSVRLTRDQFFLDSLGEELSRNVFVVSVYAFEKKLSRRKDFLVTPKKSRFS